MDSNSALISVTKGTHELVQDMKKESGDTDTGIDAVGSSSSSEGTSLQSGDKTQLEIAFLRFSSIVKEDIKSMNDSLSEKISRIEGMMAVLERRLTCLEERTGNSHSFKVAGGVPHLEESLLTTREIENNADSQTFGEKNVSASDELKFVGEKLTRLEVEFGSSEALGRIEKRLINIEEIMLRKVTKKPRMLFHSEFMSCHFYITGDFRSIQSPQNCSGGLVSYRPLYDEELFEIRFDDIDFKKVKFGDIMAIGMMRDPDSEIKKLSRISCRKGTWSIVSQREKSSDYAGMFKDDTRMESEYPLKLHKFRNGAVLGVVRKKNGDVHFFLNGVDKGLSFQDVPNDVYFFIDIPPSVVQISIVD